MGTNVWSKFLEETSSGLIQRAQEVEPINREAKSGFLREHHSEVFGLQNAQTVAVSGYNVSLGFFLQSYAFLCLKVPVDMCTCFTRRHFVTAQGQVIRVLS